MIALPLCARHLKANFDSGADIGASFCATVEGETVVDLWGGFADEARTQPWLKDTIVNVYSTTKTMTALTALLIADRGELDFDAPVARYWPEFAANGKERHQGQPSDEPFRRTIRLEGEDRQRGPLRLGEGHRAARRAGAVLGAGHGARLSRADAGLSRRRSRAADHRASVGTVFREEIAEPLGADFHIGLASIGRLRASPNSSRRRPADTIAMRPRRANCRRTWRTIPGIDVAETRTRAWRGAEIPAAGGTGNARSVAEIQTILANGGDGQGQALSCRKPAAARRWNRRSKAPI